MPCDLAATLSIPDVLREPDKPEHLDFLRHCASCEPCAAALRQAESPVESPPAEIGRAPLWLGAAGLLILVALLLVWAGTRDDSPEVGPTPPGTARGAGEMPSGVGDPDVPEAEEALSIVRKLSLASGESIALAHAQLPTDAPLVVDLEIAAEGDGVEAFEGRVLQADRDPTPLRAVIRGGTRETARVEIPAGSLVAGRAIIEIRTTEKTPLPLRRYEIVVR